MTHNALKPNNDRHITPTSDDYLFVTVYGKFKGVKENDTVLLERESKVCRYKVHSIQYFTPYGEEFLGKLLWVGEGV